MSRRFARVSSAIDLIIIIHLFIWVWRKSQWDRSSRISHSFSPHTVCAEFVDMAECIKHHVNMRHRAKKKNTNQNKLHTSIPNLFSNQYVKFEYARRSNEYYYYCCCYNKVHRKFWTKFRRLKPSTLDCFKISSKATYCGISEALSEEQNFSWIVCSKINFTGGASVKIRGCIFHVSLSVSDFTLKFLIFSRLLYTLMNTRFNLAKWKFFSHIFRRFTTQQTIDASSPFLIFLLNSQAWYSLGLTHFYFQHLPIHIHIKIHANGSRNRSNQTGDIH